MSFRNLSPQAMCEKPALEHRPEFSFTGQSRADVDAWRNAALPKVVLAKVKDLTCSGYLAHPF